MADLTITVSESLTLNGASQGSSNKMVITGINEVERRVVTCPTSEITLITFAAAYDAGTYVAGDVRYVRITNKDDTNSVMVTAAGANATNYSIRLDPGASYLIQSDSTAGTGVVDYGDITGDTLEDLSSITGIADTATVDLEMFIATI